LRTHARNEYDHAHPSNIKQLIATCDDGNSTINASCHFKLRGLARQYHIFHIYNTSLLADNVMGVWLCSLTVISGEDGHCQRPPQLKHRGLHTTSTVPLGINNYGLATLSRLSLGTKRILQLPVCTYRRFCFDAIRNRIRRHSLCFSVV
jgi:hypothetical protein